jgi:hypothetical protein
VGAAEPPQLCNQKYQKLLVPKTCRGHELDLTVNPFPTLPFFTCGEELFPRYGGFEGHSFLCLLFYYRRRGAE